MSSLPELEELFDENTLLVEENLRLEVMRDCYESAIEELQYALAKVRAVRPRTRRAIRYAMDYAAEVMAGARRD